VTAWQRARLFLVAVALGAAAWLGLKDGINDLRNAETAGQSVASMFQIIYGVSAIAALVGIFRGASFTRPALLLWGISVTATGTLAVVVWGGATWGTAVLAGASSLVIVLLILWGAWAHLASGNVTTTIKS
jgi:hypothetical protein